MCYEHSQFHQSISSSPVHRSRHEWKISICWGFFNSDHGWSGSASTQGTVYTVPEYFVGAVTPAKRVSWRFVLDTACSTAVFSTVSDERLTLPVRTPRLQRPCARAPAGHAVARRYGVSDMTYSEYSNSDAASGQNSVTSGKTTMIFQRRRLADQFIPGHGSR